MDVFSYQDKDQSMPTAEIYYPEEFFKGINTTGMNGIETVNLILRFNKDGNVHTLFLDEDKRPLRLDTRFTDDSDLSLVPVPFHLSGNAKIVGESTDYVFSPEGLLIAQQSHLAYVLNGREEFCSRATTHYTYADTGSTKWGRPEYKVIETISY